MSRFLLIIALLLLPAGALGQVAFTEIMYDLDGADSGHEWVEIQNIGFEPIDITDWRFRENDINHRLSSDRELLLGSGEVAVIADNSITFSADWPTFSGLLIDSSFSLKNTGELLELLNSNLEVIDTVSYLDSGGAAGDSNSLQLDNGEWIAAKPTPGKAVVLETEERSSDSEEVMDEEPEPIQSPPGGGGGGESAYVPQIYAYAGEDRKVTVGAVSEFNGVAYGESGDHIVNARFLWNFGDGSIREGQHVLHHYVYPGEYRVWLSVGAGVIAIGDNVVVEALPAKIALSAANPEYVELFNMGSDDLNLSWWFLKTDDSYFSFPEHTVLLPNSSVRFPSDTTGLFPSSSHEVSLHYPNGSDVEYSVFPPFPPPGIADVKVIKAPNNPQMTETVSVSSDIGTSTITTAFAGNSLPDLPTGKIDYKWIIALAALIALGVFAILVRERRESDEYILLDP